MEGTSVKSAAFRVVPPVPPTKNPMRLKAPCDACPFRKDIPPYLTRARVGQIERELTTTDATFPCHKTVPELTRRPTDEEAVCAGATALLEKLDTRPLYWRLAVATGLYEPNSIDGSATFDSFEEMKDAQGG